MFAQHQLPEETLAWLLAPESPGVRYLTLRDLLNRATDDPELCQARRAAHSNGPIATILAQVITLSAQADSFSGHALPIGTRFVLKARSEP